MPAQESGPAIHVIGGVMVDLIMGPVTPWPRPGTETFVDHSELRVGGPAGNTGLALRALGTPHHVVCNIGNDMFGAWLMQRFGDAAQAWEKVARPTALSVAIEHPGGERSFFTTAGNLAAQTAQGFLDALPAKAGSGDIALLAGAFLYPDLTGDFETMLAAIGQRGFGVALDTGWPTDGWTDGVRDVATRWLGHCDHVLLNEIECQSLSGAASIEASAGWLRAHMKASAMLVMKRGADGASAWRDGGRFDAPAPRVDVVDTTGAGDAFNAGYLAAILRGAPITTALEEGVEVASAAIASAPRQYRPLNRKRQETT